jgi:hypothetical protein
VDDRVKDLCVRLVSSTGNAFDPDWFDDSDAWDFVLQLVELGKQETPLSQITLTIGLDLGIALGLKPGAAEESYLPALERQFGPCPHSPEVIVELVRYVRGQLNGSFEGIRDPRNRLLGESKAPPVPHKNYDYS